MKELEGLSVLDAGTFCFHKFLCIVWDGILCRCTALFLYFIMPEYLCHDAMIDHPVLVNIEKAEKLKL